MSTTDDATPARRSWTLAVVVGSVLTVFAVVATWRVDGGDDPVVAGPAIPDGGFQAKASHRAARFVAALGVDSRSWELRSGIDGTLVLELSDKTGLLASIAVPVLRGQRVGVTFSPQGRRAGLSEFQLQRIGKGPPAVAAAAAPEGRNRIAGSGPVAAHGLADPPVWRAVLAVVFAGIRETDDPSILTYETRMSFGEDVRYNWQALSGDSVSCLQFADPRGLRLVVMPTAARAVSTTAWIPPRTIGVVEEIAANIQAGSPGIPLLEFEWHDTSSEVVGRWRLNAMVKDRNDQPWVRVGPAGNPFVLDEGDGGPVVPR